MEEENQNFVHSHLFHVAFYGTVVFLHTIYNYTNPDIVIEVNVLEELVVFSIVFVIFVCLATKSEFSVDVKYAYLASLDLGWMLTVRNIFAQYYSFGIIDEYYTQGSLCWMLLSFDVSRYILLASALLVTAVLTHYMIVR